MVFVSSSFLHLPETIHFFGAGAGVSSACVQVVSADTSPGLLQSHLLETNDESWAAPGGAAVDAGRYR
jgi:hypothetical protein